MYVICNRRLHGARMQSNTLRILRTLLAMTMKCVYEAPGASEAAGIKCGTALLYVWLKRKAVKDTGVPLTTLFMHLAGGKCIFAGSMMNNN